jgi:Holliday junction resolvase RusA-like endonuclease
VSRRWTPQDLANHQMRRGKAPMLSSAFTSTNRPGVHVVIVGDPVAKPRQTRSDKWKERPCVVRYRNWADKARSVAGDIPAAAQHANIICYLPMPQSWSGKKRSEMAGTPHRVKPDLDNLIKSCFDALLPRDQIIHEVKAKKRWEDEQGSRVEISIY